MDRWQLAPQGLCDFIDASPSPFHVCATVAERLRAAGYVELSERDAWPSGGPATSRCAAGSLVAWKSARPRRSRSASSAVTPTARTCGSSSIPTGWSAGWQVVALEPYGGAWLNSWLDRDLGISGRLSVRDGPAPSRTCWCASTIRSCGCRSWRSTCPTTARASSSIRSGTSTPSGASATGPAVRRLRGRRGGRRPAARCSLRT